MSKDSDSDFDEACEFIIPFGKYKGWKIKDVGDDDSGLLYLDWLIGQDWLKDPLKKFLEIYLLDESIQKELESLIDEED